MYPTVSQRPCQPHLSEPTPPPPSPPAGPPPLPPHTPPPPPPPPPHTYQRPHALTDARPDWISARHHDAIATRAPAPTTWPRSPCHFANSPLSAHPTSPSSPQTTLSPKSRPRPPPPGRATTSPLPTTSPHPSPPSRARAHPPWLPPPPPPSAGASPTTHPGLFAARHPHRAAALLTTPRAYPFWSASLSSPPPLPRPSGLPPLTPAPAYPTLSAAIPSRATAHAAPQRHLSSAAPTRPLANHYSLSPNHEPEVPPSHHALPQPHASRLDTPPTLEQPAHHHQPPTAPQHLNPLPSAPTNNNLAYPTPAPHARPHHQSAHYLMTPERATLLDRTYRAPQSTPPLPVTLLHPHAPALPLPSARIPPQTPSTDNSLAPSYFPIPPPPRQLPPRLTAAHIARLPRREIDTAANLSRNTTALVCPNPHPNLLAPPHETLGPTRVATPSATLSLKLPPQPDDLSRRLRAHSSPLYPPPALPPPYPHHRSPPMLHPYIRSLLNRTLHASNPSAPTLAPPSGQVSRPHPRNLPGSCPYPSLPPPPLCPNVPRAASPAPDHHGTHPQPCHDQELTLHPLPITPPSPLYRFSHPLPLRTTSPSIAYPPAYRILPILTSLANTHQLQLDSPALPPLYTL